MRSNLIIFIVVFVFSLTVSGFSNEQAQLPLPNVAATTTLSDSTTVSCSTAKPVAEDSTKKGVITLRWRTESEQDNYGFNVYRSESKEGQFEKINLKIIRGHGTTSEPHDYVYVDNEVYKGKTYYYYLMDVDFSGNTKKFTPTINRYLPTDAEAQAEKEKKLAKKTESDEKKKVSPSEPKLVQKTKKEKSGAFLFFWVFISGLIVSLFG